MKQTTLGCKAQTATEYLIILAVVIIISLIVVGVFAAVPGIGGSSGRAAGDAFWATSSIGIDAHSFSATQGSRLILKNNNPSAIEILDVRIHTSTVNVANETSSIFEAGNASLNNQTLSAGAIVTYVENSSIGDAQLRERWQHGCGSVGADYAVYLHIEYRDVVTNQLRTFNGGNRQLVGSCSQ